ncbi:uncharacterized protein EI90DRAFT_2393639 [Cantharellus anzutake]|uniref:uncharacterized protein n=1 Tax=Cantharellus anzutake TaxID=1750568 RepID=UPI001902E3D2|nr:uncharacterized protein EI90DRAFT_2393639 [Cantharellus anzutake]KAF8322981.1 hypothetical protein EI90DRAFT_2393639 [Cantharellus anzutake]
MHRQRIDDRRRLPANLTYPRRYSPKPRWLLRTYPLPLEFLPSPIYPLLVFFTASLLGYQVIHKTSFDRPRGRLPVNLSTGTLRPALPVAIIVFPQNRHFCHHPRYLHIAVINNERVLAGLLLRLPRRRPRRHLRLHLLSDVRVRWLRLYLYRRFRRSHSHLEDHILPAPLLLNFLHHQYCHRHRHPHRQLHLQRAQQLTTTGVKKQPIQRRHPVLLLTSPSPYTSIRVNNRHHRDQA